MIKAKSIVASLELFDQLSIIIDHWPTTTSSGHFSRPFNSIYSYPFCQVVLFNVSLSGSTHNLFLVNHMTKTEDA